MTQTQAILADLKAGMILTDMKSLRRHKCRRLAARIFDLRKCGHPIQSRIIQRGDKRFAAYWL